MNKPTNVKELCEFIWYLEDKYNLLDFEISGNKPWQAHRIEIYYQIGKLSGVFENEFQRGMTKFEKLKSLKSLIFNSIFFNPFISLKEVDYLIFSHPRSKIVNNKPIDIYTQYFIDEIKNNKFIEYEEQFNGKHIREVKPYKRYFDYINLYRNIKPKFIKINLTENQEKFIQKIENEIYNILDKRYDLKTILINRSKKFIATIEIYKKILEKTKPKEIYLVPSYGKAELIYLAKQNGIKTIEFQHGTFSEYHLGYSYPNRKYLDYFPDEFWVWNEYWRNLINFPISKDNVKIYPFKYLEQEKQKYNLKKIKNQMVILCQGGITDRMAKKILDNFEKFKNYDLIFKLHPEEYGKSNLYENLIKLQKIKPIKIVENIDLYKLLAQSEYQAGVFSTALYEGIEFGCKTILFNLPGIEYMDKFIDMYKVEVI